MCACACAPARPERGPGGLPGPRGDRAAPATDEGGLLKSCKYTFCETPWPSCRRPRRAAQERRRGRGRAGSRRLHQGGCLRSPSNAGFFYIKDELDSTSQRKKPGWETRSGPASRGPPPATRPGRPSGRPAGGEGALRGSPGGESRGGSTRGAGAGSPGLRRAAASWKAPRARLHEARVGAAPLLSQQRPCHERACKAPPSRLPRGAGGRLGGAAGEARPGGRGTRPAGKSDVRGPHPVLPVPPPPAWGGRPRVRGHRP